MPRQQPRNAFALLLMTSVAGCPAGPAEECQVPSDCAPPGDPPCVACAAPSVELCVAGACEARPSDEVDLSATFLIARAVDGVQGLLFAVAPDAACASLSDTFPGSLNVLLAGQRTLTGGDLHPDVGLGRVPPGAVAIYALATAEPAGEGGVLARGCVTFDAVAPSTSAPPLDLLP